MTVTLMRLSKIAEWNVGRMCDNLHQMTTSVYLLTFLSLSSSQTRMKIIQALCVSSPLNPWRPNQPTPTLPPPPTAKTLWSSMGRWVCGHTYTLWLKLFFYVWELLVLWRRNKTRTNSSAINCLRLTSYYNGGMTLPGFVTLTHKFVINQIKVATYAT